MGSGPVNASPSDEEVEQAVLDYLRAHPNAGDTLEGIAGWWMARQRVEIAVQVVARALTRLLQRGLIEASGPPDRPWYRLLTAIVLILLIEGWTTPF